MKSSITFAAGLVAFVLFAASASAVDIENVDGDAYRVSISGDNSAPGDFELSPGRRESDICVERCTISVDGVGSIEADEDDVVVIRDGQLSKQPKRL